MPFEHVEGRLAFLKAKLKTTPAQEPQWNNLAAADAPRSGWCATQSFAVGWPLRQLGSRAVDGPRPDGIVSPVDLPRRQQQVDRSRHAAPAALAPRHPKGCRGRASI